MSIQNTVTLGASTYTVSAGAGDSSVENVGAAAQEAVQALESKSKEGKITQDLLDHLQTTISKKYNVELTITLEDAKQCESNLQSLIEQMPVDVNAAMALFQRLAQEMRNANRQIRASELDAQVSDLLGAAKEMQTAAKLRLVAGCVQGSMQIASGLNQIYGASKQLSQFKDNVSQPDAISKDQKLDAVEVQNRQNVQDYHGRIADITGKKIDAAVKMLEGSGTITASALNFHADLADSTAKTKEATARLHESSMTEANEMMQQMMEVIRDVRDKVSAMQQASIETNRGIARNI